MSSLLWCKVCARGDWELLANDSDDKRDWGCKMGPDGANQILTLSLIDLEISLSGDDADSETKAKHRVWILTLVVSKGFSAKITVLNLYLLI